MEQKKFVQMSSKKLHELLQTVDAEDAAEIRKLLTARGTLEPDEKKYAVLKKIGDYSAVVIREFDNLNSAKQFVTLMYESETKDFIQYSIAKMIQL